MGYGGQAGTLAQREKSEHYVHEQCSHEMLIFSMASEVWVFFFGLSAKSNI